MKIACIPAVPQKIHRSHETCISVSFGKANSRNCWSGMSGVESNFLPQCYHCQNSGHENASSSLIDIFFQRAQTELEVRLLLNLFEVSHSKICLAPIFSLYLDLAAWDVVSQDRKLLPALHTGYMGSDMSLLVIILNGCCKNISTL